MSSVAFSMLAFGATKRLSKGPDAFLALKVGRSYQKPPKTAGFLTLFALKKKQTSETVWNSQVFYLIHKPPFPQTTSSANPCATRETATACKLSIEEERPCTLKPSCTWTTGTSQKKSPKPTPRTIRKSRLLSIFCLLESPRKIPTNIDETHNGEFHGHLLDAFLQLFLHRVKDTAFVCESALETFFNALILSSNAFSRMIPFLHELMGKQHLTFVVLALFLQLGPPSIQIDSPTASFWKALVVQKPPENTYCEGWYIKIVSFHQKPLKQSSFPFPHLAQWPSFSLLWAQKASRSTLAALPDKCPPESGRWLADLRFS